MFDRDENQTPSRAGEAQPLAVLLVEDDPNDFALFKRAFHKAGSAAELHWARTASEALSLLEGWRESHLRICVVADIQLPDASGFELLESVRGLHFDRSLRFTFLTGRCDRGTESRAVAAGVDRFFVKDARTESLVDIVQGVHGVMSGGGQ